jgi:alkanesulfonate monooxygenase SsuD/methylene tetrahydromethanopterin reductase-like flavin-dependent oxidoreductase (luciferase family)
MRRGNQERPYHDHNMRYGFFTMPLHPPAVPLADTLAEDLQQLVFLDELGFSEAWIGEHLTSGWENIPAPDLLIAQALNLTKNIKFGTGVNCLPNHNPVMLAHRVAQLDHMARGRFYWGIGSGGFVGDLQLFEVDDKSGQNRFVSLDVLDTVLKLWSDPQPGVYEHARWRYRIPEPDPTISMGMYYRPYQLPHPPIGVAGVTPNSEMYKLAGGRGWMPMSLNLVPTSSLQRNWETYAEAATQAGNMPDRQAWRVARDIYVGDSTEQARKEALEGVLGRDWREYFIPLLGSGKRLSLCKVDPDMPDEAVTPEYLLDNIWLVGDPDSVAAQLQEVVDRTGGFGTLLLMGHEWQPREKWERSMQLFMQEVVPRLRIAEPVAT